MTGRNNRGLGLTLEMIVPVGVRTQFLYGAEGTTRLEELATTEMMILWRTTDLGELVTKGLMKMEMRIVPATRSGAGAVTSMTTEATRAPAVMLGTRTRLMGAEGFLMQTTADGWQSLVALQPLAGFVGPVRGAPLTEMEFTVEAGL